MHVKNIDQLVYQKNTRNRMRKPHILTSRWVTSLFTISIIITLFCCDAIEFIETSAKTRDEAAKKGIAGQGRWVPLEIFSNKVRDIKIKYDIDTNEVWARYVDNIDRIINNKYCYIIDDRKEIDLPRKRRSKKIKWWPKDLMDKEFGDLPNHYVYYECKDEGFLAKEYKSNIIYYWHLYQ
jgi:hypothetical protein